MKFLMFVVVGACASFSSCAQSSSTELTTEEFKKLMDEQSDVVILDVRTADEIKSGTIGKPVVIDYFAKDFENSIKALDKQKTYLVYCASGFRSGETVNIMIKNGFKKAFNLRGGFHEWKKKKLPIQK
jgi:rhodanese-related sulfurtransferase